MFKAGARDQVDGAGRRKVALPDEVRTLRDLHALDHFGNDEVRVAEALTVGVRHHVDRYAVDRERQIRAVVGIEATHEILVRLPAARVLHQHESRRYAQDVLHAPDRPQLEIAVADRER